MEGYAMSKLRALFCAVVLTGQMGTAMAQQWIEHRPAGGGYRVEMPGRPQVSTRVIQHEAGPLTLTEADVEFGDSFFTVSYVDMPVDKMKTFSADKLLDGARDGTVAGMTIDGNKAALRHEDRLTVSGYPARHLVIEIPSLRLVSVMRLVLVRNRKISFGFSGPGGSETRPGVARFINSFAVLAAENANIGLTGKLRDAFVTSAVQGCLKSQNDNPANAGVPADFISRYCVCYAERTANITTAEELSGPPPSGSLPAFMQEKINSVGPLCLQEMMGR
jgi:hypothetical protein